MTKIPRLLTAVLAGACLLGASLAERRVPRRLVHVLIPPGEMTDSERGERSRGPLPFVISGQAPYRLALGPEQQDGAVVMTTSTSPWSCSMRSSSYWIR